MHSSRMRTVRSSGRLWEMSAQGRVSAGEGYLPRRVPARGGGGVCPGGGSALGGGVCPGGVSARHLPLVTRITDRCKNIT